MNFYLQLKMIIPIAATVNKLLRSYGFFPLCLTMATGFIII
ncbi:hypothetical protein EVA_13350 [gut metagenome]|uniref:Uncharacterized protein n=1 Tax=gut metagenome TaxID=749906 RepID=J9GGR0_9ZZZZ